MSDGLDGGDLFLGLLVGWFFGQSQSQSTGHSHGDHWHRHPCPRGLHVHDGHLDGPIRIVPPPPKEPVDPVVARGRARAIGMAAGALALWVGGAGAHGWMMVLAVVAGMCALLVRDYSERIDAAAAAEAEAARRAAQSADAHPGGVLKAEVVEVHREEQRPPTRHLPPGKELR